MKLNTLTFNRSIVINRITSYYDTTNFQISNCLYKFAFLCSNYVFLGTEGDGEKTRETHANLKPNNGNYFKIIPYKLEDPLEQKTLIISWLLDKPIKSESLRNPFVIETEEVVASLKKLSEDENKNKLRRILDADLKLIEPYLCSNLNSKLQELKKCSASINYSCDTCLITFLREDPAWRCARCQMWYHRKCTAAVKQMYECKEYSFCDRCYGQ